MSGKPAQRTSRKDVHRSGAKSSALLLKKTKRKRVEMTCIALSKCICLLPTIYFRHGTARLVGTLVEQQQA